MEAVESNSRHRGFFSLLCGTINIKKNMPCIGGDSAAENDDTVDERTETRAPPPQPHVIAYWKAEPNAADEPVVIPSPVLVSKRLAEEALAKRRNVRFKGNDAADAAEEEGVERCTSPASPPADQKLAGKPRQKRMAPAPPAASDATDAAECASTPPIAESS